MEKGKYKVMGLTAASLSAMLAAAVAWGQLDLPRPAWYSEVQALEIQVVANTQLILGDKWLRLTAQIKEIEEKLKITQPNRLELIERLATFQLQLRVVNSELK